MRVLVVPTEMHKNVCWAEVPDDTKGQLTELQRLVGGYVELVQTRELSSCHPGLVMLVNEEGRNLKLPTNWRATFSFYPYECGIHGEAILLCLSDDLEEWVSLCRELGDAMIRIDAEFISQAVSYLN